MPSGRRVIALRHFRAVSPGRVLFELDASGVVACYGRKTTISAMYLDWLSPSYRDSHHYSHPAIDEDDLPIYEV